MHCRLVYVVTERLLRVEYATIKSKINIDQRVCCFLHIGHTHTDTMPNYTM